MLFEYQSLSAQFDMGIFQQLFLLFWKNENLCGSFGNLRNFGKKLQNVFCS
jgi:hypothetical protein